MLKDGFRYCQTPLGKRITCQSLLVASLLLAQQDDPEPVKQCSQGEKHPVAGLELLKVGTSRRFGTSRSWRGRSLLDAPPQRGGDFVFLRQPDYLGAELSSRTEKGHALIQPSTAIFRDQQAYERFACSSQQLNCNILGLKVIGEIGVQRLFLMAPQEFNGRVSLQVSE